MRLLFSVHSTTTQAQVCLRSRTTYQSPMAILYLKRELLQQPPTMHDIQKSISTKDGKQQRVLPIDAKYTFKNQATKEEMLAA